MPAVLLHRTASSRFLPVQDSAARRPAPRRCN